MVAFTQETKYYSGIRAGVIDQMDNTLGYMFINNGANTLFISYYLANFIIHLVHHL
jgi:hypothetical protein